MPTAALQPTYWKCKDSSVGSDVVMSKESSGSYGSKEQAQVVCCRLSSDGLFSPCCGPLLGSALAVTVQHNSVSMDLDF